MLWIFLAFAGFTILMNMGQGIITFLVLGHDAGRWSCQHRGGVM